MQVQYVSHFEAHDHSNNKKLILLLNEYLFEWILVGNLLLPLFIYFTTVDWLKYVQIKLLFHAVPPCLFAWQKFDDYIFCCLLLWLCITHQRSHWLPQGDFVYLNDCLPAFMTVHQSISHFVSQSIYQSRARQSVSKSLSCFINQSISWSVSHSIGCFVSQSVRQSFIMLVSQSGSQLSFS